MFDRILTKKKWDGAVANNSDENPRAVLVTGLNGMQKTTSMYQAWFEKILWEATFGPPTQNCKNSSPSFQLPTGQSSFFRQLDHMIVTLVHDLHALQSILN